MNLSFVVEEEIHRSPFITEAMQAGIVNISSLARLIQPEIERKIGQETSEAAIVMAIKRLPPLPAIQLDKSLSRFMRQLGDIIVRSDLTDFSFRNSPQLIQCQAKLLRLLEDEDDRFYSSCKGVHETTLICSQSLSHHVLRIFSGEKLISTRDGLAAVSIKLPPDNLDTYGVYYTILKQLAWKGINVVEVVSTSHEISLVVGTEDVEPVFSMILRLKKG